MNLKVLIIPLFMALPRHPKAMQWQCRHVAYLYGSTTPSQKYYIDNVRLVRQHHTHPNMHAMGMLKCYATNPNSVIHTTSLHK